MEMEDKNVESKRKIEIKLIDKCVKEKERRSQTDLFVLRSWAFAVAVRERPALRSSMFTIRQKVS